MAFGDLLRDAWGKTGAAADAAMEKVGDAAMAQAQMAEAQAKTAMAALGTVSRASLILLQIPPYLEAQVLAAPGPVVLSLRAVAASALDMGAKIAEMASPYSLQAKVATSIFAHLSKVFMPDDLRSAMQPCPKAIAEKLAATIIEEKKQIEVAKVKGLGNSPAVVAAQVHVDVATKALMSDDVYNDGPTVDIPGFRRMTDDEISLQLNLKPLEFNPPGSSFHSALYKSNPDPTNPNAPTHYTLAFRGTASLPDVLTDAGQGLGLETDAYNRAKALSVATNLAIELKEPNASFDLTGHSLGGGEVQAGSCVTGARGVTFNAAGLNPSTVPDCDLSALDSQVDNYHVIGEPLNTLNESVIGIPEASGTTVKLPTPPNTSVVDLHRMPSVESSLTQTGDTNIAALTSLNNNSPGGIPNVMP